MTAAKLSSQPRTESCVMSGNCAYRKLRILSRRCSLSGIRKQWKVKRGKSRLTGPPFPPGRGRGQVDGKRPSRGSEPNRHVLRPLVRYADKPSKWIATDSRPTGSYRAHAIVELRTWVSAKKR